MKKAAIIIGVVIYAISIIVVTFLGYAAEVRNPPIFADDIVPTQAVPYEYVVNGAVIYRLKNAENQQNQNNAEESSEFIQYRYEIDIVEFEYLHEVLDGEMQVSFKPISNQTDPETGEQKIPDTLDLNYTVGNDKMASVDKNGKITFKQFPDWGHLDLVVSTKDTSNINIHVKISWDVFMKREGRKQ